MKAQLRWVAVCSLLALLLAASPAAASLSDILYLLIHGEQPSVQASNNILCMACTLAVGLTEQLAYIHDEPVVQVMEKVCSYLPTTLQGWCVDLLDTYGQSIINLLELRFTPDAVCLDIGLCQNATCHLFPRPTLQQEQEQQRRYEQKQFCQPTPPSDLRLALRKVKQQQGDWDPIDWIKQIIEKVFTRHLPLVDLDNDNFSTLQELRGYSWRGKDCDDKRQQVYPGREQSSYSPSVDHNCNGIYGIDSTTGQSWEDELCSSVPTYGTVLLGDSAGAHFHIPPEWITAKDINSTTFANVVDILLNELDWPQMGASTGYESTPWIGAPVGPIASLYLQMRKQNLCSHRDYQCVAVNGMRSSAMENLVKTVARNQTTDRPVMLTYALVGNDVCNPHYGIEHMTTPEEFHKNVMNVMTYLDTTLPKGSFVSFMGLVDGRVLYDEMHARIHPIGSTRKDVTYSNFYDYLNCLQISPCFGWMNTDAYWRNQTTARAFQLNDVLKDITTNYNNFKNFKMFYFDSPIAPVIQIWKQKGGQAYQLIEPVDGFHPSGLAMAPLVNYQWELMIKQYPQLVPPLNPNNNKIANIFGNQGGY